MGESGENKINLRDKIKSAPKSPGCYLYRDSVGVIIYVGKAKNLSKRVRQYFRKGGFEWTKLNRLVRTIADVEYITTESELDALLLEHKLIKTHKPFFNAQMKADVGHPFLRIDVNAVYPTISVTTERGDDGAEYFDYFFDMDDALAVIETLNAAWHTPLCGKAEFTQGAKACMNYHIGKCVGACAGLVDAEIYSEKIREIIGFLRGERSCKLDEIKCEMGSYSEALLFEKAKACNKLLERLEWLQRKATCRMYDLSKVKRVVLLIRPYRAVEFSMFYFVNGAVVHREDFFGDEAWTDKERLIKKLVTSATEDSELHNDNTWLRNALVEVLAEKFYITLPDDVDAVRDMELISGAVNKFASKL